MDMSRYYNIENEKPLENITPDGGMCSIFRSVGCIGDSLSSGEFEVRSDEGIRSFLDFYEYSWGQFMARATGSSVINFSKGGMTAKAFMTDFYRDCGVFDSKNLCSAYIIALGVNDINRGEELGTKDDINAQNMTFTAQYSAIIHYLKRLQPNAKFFLVTIPHSGQTPEHEVLEDKHRELLYDMAEAFRNTYVIDLREYAPVYDEEFRRRFYLRGHLNPMGYKLTADMIMSYIDYIIRHNMSDFAQSGLIGTQFYSTELDKEMKK